MFDSCIERMFNKFKDKFKSNLRKNNKKGDIESDKNSTSSSPRFFVSKVLIVDDVTVNRYILRKYVEKCRPDIKIYEANNGVVAVEMNEKYHFDMIFMDIKLGGGIDGVETSKRIKMKDTHVKIVGSTGQVEREIIKQCLEVGMIKVLGKPLDKKEIEYILNGNGDSIYS
jgi:CheY-like chemotaxis protein